VDLELLKLKPPTQMDGRGNVIRTYPRRLCPMYHGANLGRVIVTGPSPRKYSLSLASHTRGSSKPSTSEFDEELEEA